MPVAELGAGLRIGGDAGGVVVGRAGDQARAQHPDQVPQRGAVPPAAGVRSAAGFFRDLVRVG